MRRRHAERGRLHARQRHDPAHGRVIPSLPAARGPAYPARRGPGAARLAGSNGGGLPNRRANPEPRTPNLEPRTPNPEPRTPNPEPNLNTNREARTPKRERPGPHPGSRSQHWGLHVRNTPKVRNQKVGADLNKTCT